MRPVHIFTGSVVALVAVMLFVPSGHGEEAPAKAATFGKSVREIELENKIDELQRQNEGLRAELKAEREQGKTVERLHQQRGILQAPSDSSTLSLEYLKNGRPGTSTTPEGWIKKEFNGQPVYIIPLSN